MATQGGGGEMLREEERDGIRRNVRINRGGLHLNGAVGTGRVKCFLSPVHVRTDTACCQCIPEALAL